MYKNCLNHLKIYNDMYSLCICNRYMQKITNQMIYMYQYPNVHVQSSGVYSSHNSIRFSLNPNFDSNNENNCFWDCKSLKIILNDDCEVMYKIIESEKNNFVFDVRGLNSNECIRSLSFGVKEESFSKIIYRFQFPIVILYKKIHPWYKQNATQFNSILETSKETSPYSHYRIIVRKENKKYLFFENDIMLSLPFKNE